MPRLKSTFIEPNQLASFIVSTMPILLYFFCNKNIIVREKKHRKIIFFLFLCLLLFNFILTQSPIFILFGILISCLYFNIMHTISKKMFLILFIICFIFLLCTYIFPFDGLFLNRIYKVLHAIQEKNIKELVYADPSLGTRITSFLNAYILFTKNWFLGIGLGNMNLHLSMQLWNSSLPLTPEIIMRLHTGDNNVNASINTKLLCEIGIWGTLIYYYIFFKLNELLNKVKSTDPQKQNLFKTLQVIILAHIMLSFYQSSIYTYTIYIVTGITVGLLYQNKKEIS